MSIDWQEQCERDYAWNAAREDLVMSDTKNISNLDSQWKKCVAYNHIICMDDTCWTAIKAQYPRL